MFSCRLLSSQKLRIVCVNVERARLLFRTFPQRREKSSPREFSRRITFRQRKFPSLSDNIFLTWRSIAWWVYSACSSPRAVSIETKKRKKRNSRISSVLPRRGLPSSLKGTTPSFVLNFQYFNAKSECCSPDNVSSISKGIEIFFRLFVSFSLFLSLCSLSVRERSLTRLVRGALVDYTGKLQMQIPLVLSSIYRWRELIHPVILEITRSKLPFPGPSRPLRSSPLRHAVWILNPRQLVSPWI